MPSSPDTVATGPAAQRPSTVPPLVRATQRLEQSSSLDGLRRVYGTLAAPLDRWSGSELLRSGLVGHALHPVLTDVPIGCWTAASAMGEALLQRLPERAGLTSQLES